MAISPPLRVLALAFLVAGCVSRPERVEIPLPLVDEETRRAIEEEVRKGMADEQDTEPDCPKAAPMPGVPEPGVTVPMPRVAPDDKYTWPSPKRLPCGEAWLHKIATDETKATR